MFSLLNYCKYPNLIGLAEVGEKKNLIGFVSTWKMYRQLSFPEIKYLQGSFFSKSGSRVDCDFESSPRYLAQH